MCEAIKCSTLCGKHFDMDEASPNLKLLAHVINLRAHDKNVLVSARLCGNHQVNICRLAGVDARNPRLLPLLTTVVSLLGMGSFFMRLFASMDIYFDTCVVDFRNEPPPQACNSFAKVLGDYTMRNYKMLRHAEAE